ncbi:MAG: HAD-IA family hydrolase [Spirochaetota bacterium]|nr:HAD-IA family hydrolase [Spirochaetota bacterium]
MKEISLKEQLSKIELLIFDIDGVLVDVSNSYRLAIKNTVEFFFQKEINSNEIQDLKNETGFNNDWDLTEELLKRKGLTLPRKDIVSKFQSFYWGSDGDGLIQHETWLLDNKIIKSISQKYLTAIFTGRPRLEAEFVLNTNQTINYFNPIVAMEDVINGKPNPEGINKICTELSIPPERTCYIGDTFDDIRAAVRANVTPIAIIPPMGKNDLYNSFLDLGACAVFTKINNLFEHAFF